MTLSFLVLNTIGFATTHVVVFQSNWSNNTLKSGFFRISGKTGSRIRNFFSLKPPCGQDGANKKKFSQIGPAVPELLSLTHTNRQRSYYFRVRISFFFINIIRLSIVWCDFSYNLFWADLKRNLMLKHYELLVLSGN